MHNSNQNMQDQSGCQIRSNTGMEDSTITIEFLRARLLSERSISRSARQRVDELEKMVDELEEQLKIVSLQRKKAEKATEDVLAILENQGISDMSEVSDSSSDQETHQESNLKNNLTNEQESFVISKVRRNEQEELSGSDLDSSLTPSRSLSWKGRIDSSRSREKYKDASTRRRSNVSSIGSSSPRHHLGKSCRQIKHRETRSALKGFNVEPAKFDSQENGAAASCEDLPNCSDGGPEILREGSEFQEEKVLLKDSYSGSKEDQRNSDLDLNGHERVKDMEKALEHQAQLICQNEEMEKVQREWEEKFRENNTSTPDSCDPGNHSDITEERDEIKALMSCSGGMAISQPQDANSKDRDVCLAKEMCKTLPNGFSPPSHVDMGGLAKEMPKTLPNGFSPPSHVDMGGLQDQRNRSTSKSQDQEFAFPTENGKQNQESLEKHAHQLSHGSHNDPLLNRSAHNRSSDASSSEVGSSFHKGDASGSRNDLYALVPHESRGRLGGVLDALKQAKLSLQQKMTRLPLVDGMSVHKSIVPSVPAIQTRDRVEIPVGCAGLFRLPTDFAAEEAATQSSFFGSSLPSARYSPENGVSVTATDVFVTSPYVETRPTLSTNAADRFATSPYIETRPNFSSNAADRFVTNHYVETRPNFPSNAADRFVTSPYLETRLNFSADNGFLNGRFVESGSRVSTPKPHFDPYSDMGLPSSRYTNPSYPTNHPSYPNYPSVPDPTPWINSDEVITRAPPRRPAGAPADRLPYYDDHIRHNMYR